MRLRFVGKQFIVIGLHLDLVVYSRSPESRFAGSRPGWGVSRQEVGPVPVVSPSSSICNHLALGLSAPLDDLLVTNKQHHLRLKSSAKLPNSPKCMSKSTLLDDDTLLMDRYLFKHDPLP